MTRYDIALWTDIERDAEEFFPIEGELFLQQFGDEIPAIGWRCFILRDPRGIGAGTISAWRNGSFRGEAWGQIHWLAIRPAYQGQRLGSAMMAHALGELAKYHDKVYLDTDVRRTAAIALYLKFGFVPDMVPVNAEKAWSKLDGVIDHPALDAALGR